ncbi:MAG: class I SAM-dependent methyltransferase [Myxococcota bacterium]
MQPLAAEGPNAQQITYWNEVSGAKWVALHEVIDAQIEPLGTAAMDRAAPAPGERVLDVGCGCGQTSLELARRVGPSGAVEGVDISAPMLARARERARDAGLANARFHQADAQTARFGGDAEGALPAGFDLVFSRFGVMFFADPQAAFANLLGALRPGGRIAWATWQALADNPWMRVPMAAAAAHLPKADPPPPDAPGPFALADAARVERLLRAAGFEDVAHESVVRELRVGGGGTLDEAVSFLVQMGPMGAALRDATDAVRAAATADVRVALAPYYDGTAVRLPAACWVVTARRPATAR